VAKKEVLWVEWVYERYIKHKTWWDYTPPHESSWYWKKISRIKDDFKRGCREPLVWDWQGDSDYRVAQGYKWW